MIYRVSVYRVAGGMPEPDPIESWAYGDVLGARESWRTACRRYNAMGAPSAAYAIDLLAALDGGETALLLDAHTEGHETDRYRVTLTVQLGECSTGQEG